MKNQNFDEFINYSLEIILQSLSLAEKKSEKLRNIGDISGSELIEKEFFPKYEKLYFALKTDEFSKKLEENIEERSQIKKILNDIKEKNGLTSEFIEEQLEKRKKLKGNSGSEVVKKLYEYELKELRKKKNEYLKEADEILKKEFEINVELSNAVQQEEQNEIVYKLHPLREKFRILDKKILEVEEKEKKIEEKLFSEWRYEIYGTIDENTLKKNYEEFYGEKDE